MDLSTDLLRSCNIIFYRANGGKKIHGHPVFLCFSQVLLKAFAEQSVYKALPASPPSVATANGHTSGLA
jgi:hypothetical protein